MSRNTIVIAFVCVMTAILPHRALAAESAFQITTVSNRPDKISGGDALVRINVPDNVAAGQISVRLNGQDITPSFRPDAAEHAWMGLVKGLKLGPNQLEVFAKALGTGTPAAQLTLTNFPITGPVFSGPQEKPFICSTESFKLPDGSTLGPPLDANCSAKTVVQYLYKSTAAPSKPDARVINAGLKPLANLKALPADTAWTTTSTGQKVPYVVRIETGTINRGIYQIAMLHDPTSEPEPGPSVSPKGWNHRLMYSFGPSCDGGWYRQGTTLGVSGGVVDDAIVGKGYAEAASTLNVFGNNCNDLLAAETMMMVKERFVEAFGKPLFTMGQGASGGSYQQLQIADNYPGLLDGILPGATFPDILATVQALSDMQLLHEYFVKRPDALTEKQKVAVSGVGNLKSVTVGATQAGRINPTVYCPQELPKAMRYDPVSNPGGARCDVFDHTVNVYGKDPATGAARRPLDNTGVQYGLAALNSGAINATQFLDLNERVGGFDKDGNIIPQRSIGDPVALRAAYRTGRLTNGGGGLGKIPIIDIRPYRDQTDAGDFHLKFHSFTLRERLRKANGTIANEILLVSAGGFSNPELQDYATAKMDEWLTKLGKDSASGSVMDKIVRAKPADLTDSCYTASGERIVEPQTFTGGRCNETLPAFPSPRMVAGGPMTNDVLKCQLKPVDMKDYKVTFTEAEKKRLTSIFPTGVCNFTKPGVEQQPLAGSWLSF
jgi:hypothetical protein